MYQPDNWIILKINGDLGSCFYKVLAGWSGGYLDSDYWRINSGITKIEDDDKYWLLKGETGSIYKCHKESQCVRMNISGILSQLLDIKNVEVIQIEDILGILKE